MLASPKEYTLSQRAMFAALLGSLVYIFVFMNTASYTRVLDNEIQASREIIGNEDFKPVVNRAKLFFSITDGLLNPIRETNNNIETSTSKYKLVNQVSEKLSETGTKLRLLLYQACYRFSLLMYWSWTLLPMVLAMLFEGYNIRRIKMFEFGNTSEKRQRIWLKIIMFSIFFLNLYFIAPLSGDFGALFPPVLMAITAFLARNVITHVTKTW